MELSSLQRVQDATESFFDRTNGTFYNWYRFPFTTRIEVTSQLSDISIKCCNCGFGICASLNITRPWDENELPKALSDHFFGLIHQWRQQNTSLGLGLREGMLLCRQTSSRMHFDEQLSYTMEQQETCVES
jgi:hypothetical protein